MMLAPLVLFLAQGPPPGAAVSGVVRSAEDSLPLPGVLVELEGSTRRVVTDSAGHYLLAELPSGTLRLHFSRAGRIPLDFAVIIRDAALVRVDVELSARPTELAPIVVTARRLPEPGAGDQAATLRLGPDWAHTVLPGPGELRNALAALPGAATRGETAGTLNFQGGESDQVGFELDGFPVLGATHFGPSLSAVNPDLVRGISVYLGAPPAHVGGWLSGTVLLASTLFSADSPAIQGAVTPAEVRQLWRGTLSSSGGRFLLSGRRSFRNLLGDGLPPESGNGYEDWLGTMALPLGGGRLRLFLLESRNQLGFPGRTEGKAAEGNWFAESPAGPGNKLEWRTGTAGVGWEGNLASRGSLFVRAWRASTTSAAEWQGSDAPVALASRYRQLGLRADGTLRWRTHSLEFGAAVSQDGTSYSSGRSAAQPSLSLANRSNLVAGYLEHRWRLASFGSIRTGLRADYLGTGWVGFEPRLGLELRPTKGLRATIEAGRIHQFSQSLRNQESFLSSILAFELPASVGVAGLPIATADNLSLALEASLGQRTTLSLLSYARRLRGLLLLAGTTAHPFVEGLGQAGKGSASGAELRLTHTGGLVRFETALAASSALRQIGSQSRYRPGFLRALRFGSQVTIAPDQFTRLGLAFQAGSGQPTSLIPEVEWQPYGPFRGGELAGTPDNLDPAINRRRLPGFVRLDFGLSRRWRLPQGLGGGSLATALAVDNLFNRRNPIALMAGGSAGAPNTLLWSPRTLRVEVGWRF